MRQDKHLWDLFIQFFQPMFSYMSTPFNYAGLVPCMGNLCVRVCDQLPNKIVGTYRSAYQNWSFFAKLDFCLKGMEEEVFSKTNIV